MKILFYSLLVLLLVISYIMKKCLMAEDYSYSDSKHIIVGVCVVLTVIIGITVFIVLFNM